MTEPDPKNPKIIVDEDWKTRVQTEKEALKEEKATEEKETPKSDDPSHDVPIPEASFSLLATTLATQALAAMGQMPVPGAEEVTVSLSMARHFIDTLSVLEQKTKGNLDPEEEQLLAGFLHELRMTFVMVQNKIQTEGSTE